MQCSRALWKTLQSGVETLQSNLETLQSNVGKLSSPLWRPLQPIVETLQMAPVDIIKASPLHIIGNSTNINNIITTTFTTTISRTIGGLSHWRDHRIGEGIYTINIITIITIT